jgi:hypothetical protein
VPLFCYCKKYCYKHECSGVSHLNGS